MIHSEVTPNGASAPTIAEHRAATYRAAGLPSKPTGRGSVQGLGRNVRSWALAAALGLLVGTVGTLGATSQLAPLAGAQRVTNAEVVITNDDSRWFVISAWAVRLPSPLAPSGQ